MLYCRYCEHHGSVRTMAAHEATCIHNPNRVDEMPEPPVEYPHVPRDHFRKQFERYGSETAQLDAMARHCAHLYNSMKDEQTLRLAAYRDIVQKLSDANPLVSLALSLEEAARDMEE